MAENWKEIFGSEFEWIKKLGSAISDPEEKRSFWETIKEKKMRDASYSIYQDFPRSENATVRAREQCFQFVKGLRRIEVEGEESA